MDHQKCKICEERHPLDQRCGFNAIARKAFRDNPPKDTNSLLLQSAVKKYDRNEAHRKYMKTYMQKRRLKAKK